MSQEQRLLNVTLKPGMFRNEYNVTLIVHGREISAVVDKESVIVITPPSDQTPGRGRLRVRVVEVDQTGEALVDLPRPAFTSEPRLRVPERDLVPA